MMPSMTFYIGVNKYQEKSIKLGGKIIVDLVRENFLLKTFLIPLVKTKPSL